VIRLSNFCPSLAFVPREYSNRKNRRGERESAKTQKAITDEIEDQRCAQTKDGDWGASYGPPRPKAKMPAHGLRLRPNRPPDGALIDPQADNCYEEDDSGEPSDDACHWPLAHKVRYGLPKAQRGLDDRERASQNEAYERVQCQQAGLIRGYERGESCN
jgi:hypothetical protein